MIKKLDWYIIRKFLSTFIFAILILAVIACVIDYSQKVDDFVKRGAPAAAILNYFKNFVPHIVALLFPLFIFIPVIFFTSKLAYRSEIIAILASGASFSRFLRPYIITGAFLSGVALLANHWVVPNANRDRIDFEDRYVKNVINQSDQNVHLRLSPNLYVYMHQYDYQANVGYRFTAEKIEGTRLIEKIMADRATYDSVQKVWHLYDVTIRTNDSLQETLRFEQELVRTYPSFTPKDLRFDDDIMLAWTTPELNRVIERETLRGSESLNVYYLEKHRRTAQPFAGLILTIIGASIASRKIRGGSGFHLALGIVLSAVYIMLMQFSNTFSIKAGLNPLLAVWIPNIIFSFIAWYQYRKQTR